MIKYHEVKRSMKYFFRKFYPPRIDDLFCDLLSLLIDNLFHYSNYIMLTLLFLNFRFSPEKQEIKKISSKIFSVYPILFEKWFTKNVFCSLNQFLNQTFLKDIFFFIGSLPNLYFGKNVLVKCVTSSTFI